MSVNPQDEAALTAELERAQQRDSSRAALVKAARDTVTRPESSTLAAAAHEARLALRVALAALRED